MSAVYWFILVLVLFFGALAETHPKLVIGQDGQSYLYPETVAAFLISAALTFTSALRYRVGTDYWAYYLWKVPTWAEIRNRMLHFQEPAFALLVKLSRLVWNDGQSVIFVSALITVVLFCLTIYKFSPMYLASMLLYIFTTAWQGSFNGIRFYIASAILFAGHQYILKKQFLKYCLVVFIASLFHVTALVMIIPYFIFNRKADLTQLLIMTAGSLILRFSYDEIFQLLGTIRGKVFDVQGDIYYSGSVNIFRILITFIPIAIFIFLCRKEGITPEQNFYLNAAFFNAFCMLAGIGSRYLARFGHYTNAVVIISYAYIFQLIDDEKTRKIVIFAVMTMYLLYWLYSVRAEGISTFRWIFQR